MTPKSPIERFVDEWCELGTKYRVGIAEIYEAFENWCRIRQIESPGKVTFGRALTRLGYGTGRTGRQRYRLGLRLARPGSLTAGGRLMVPNVSLRNAEGVPEPPAYLSPSAAQWWREIAEEFVLLDHHLMLLTIAAQAWDRVQSARAIIAREGMTYVNDRGALTLRPEIQIEQRSWVLFARMLRELGLEDEYDFEDLRLPEPAIPPTRTANPPTRTDAT